MYVVVSMAVGPRFLSDGLMIMSLLCLNCCRADHWMWFKFDSRRISCLLRTF